MLSYFDTKSFQVQNAFCLRRQKLVWCKCCTLRLLLRFLALDWTSLAYFSTLSYRTNASLHFFTTTYDWAMKKHLHTNEKESDRDRVFMCIKDKKARFQCAANLNLLGISTNVVTEFQKCAGIMLTYS